jgi:surface protein
MKKLYFLCCLLFFCLASNAQDEFITTWEVQSDDLDITIPVASNEYSYDYTINFGDDTVMTNLTSSITHTYASAGIYTVEITGTFPAIRMFDSEYENRIKLKSIEQWGNISWQTMYRAFMRSYDLVINAVDEPDLSLVTNMSSMFLDAENLNQSINHWDVSNVENMSNLFSGATTYNHPLDNWNVSSVTNMYQMFYGALAFNQPINSWNVSNVVTMDFMFTKNINSNPSSDPGLVFNQPLNNWNVSNVTSMTRMFAYTENFNQSLNSWDVSNVTDMDSMFTGAVAFNQPINSWNTSNVMSMDGMFAGAINFNGAVSNWDISNIENMSYLFAGATTFNQPIDAWDVSSATTMAGMFRGATAFNQPLNSWDVSNVTQMFTMFEDASSFNRPLDNWNVSSVESMNEMFKNATAFNSSLSTWVMSSIEQDDFGNGISNMFNGASSFNQPLNSWDVSGFTSLAILFQGASAFNQPLDTWDVSNVTSMSSLFEGATAFNQSIDNWDVSNVENMRDLFKDASSFNQPLNNWNTSMVEFMSSMFNGSSSFNQPLNNWDVSQVTSMSSMFNSATNFNQDLSSWNVSNVDFFQNLFRDAIVFNQPLDNWDFSQMNTSFNIYGLYGFLSHTNLSVENYDALLQHLISFDISNVYLGAEGLRYCDETSEEYLTSQLNWTIYGDGPALCNIVSGNVYFDNDNNGCDVTVIDVSNLFVFFENTDNQSVYAKQIVDGNYSGGVAGTNFTASVQGLPDFMTANPVDAIVDFSGGSTNETLDFCVTTSQVVDDLSITLIPISEARPGFESTYQLVVENIGSQPISNVVVNLSFDDSMQSFVSAMPTPDVTTSSNLEFNFSAIDPFQSETVDIVLQTFTPPTVNGDDLLLFNATVIPDTNDYTPDNNTYDFEQIVVNSFDPNDINVLQGETITTDQTDDYLDYVIRFQNTGTASAINVEVQSLLHQNLNASTFRVLSSSHNYIADIENNIITFKFDNINLPDEVTDPEGSNGFIAYRVKPKSDIQIGEVMDGIAAIVFDFNEPIITNFISTEVIEPLSVDEFENDSFLSLYPNPSNEGFYITTKPGISPLSIKLYDIQGSQLLSTNKGLDYISTEHITSGIYIVVINTNKGKVVKKLIIN